VTKFYVKHLELFPGKTINRIIPSIKHKTWLLSPFQGFLYV